MTREEQKETLAQAIHRMFAEGLHPGEDVQHFIDSTFSHPTAGELEQLLSDEDESGAEPLMELIFFPDPAMQARLEPILQSAGFTAEDEADLVERLFREPPVTRIVLPQTDAEITVAVPRWAAEQFVSRLRIARTADPQLLSAIGEHVEESAQIPFQVKLRNSRFEQTGNRIGLLTAFLERVRAERPEQEEMFDFLLGFLEETPQDDDMYGALMDRKKACFRMLQQAMKFEKQLRRNNIETLLLQGIRSPHIDKDEVRHRMALIDRISYGIFGKTEYLDQIMGSTELDFDGEYDMDRIFRTFS